MLIYRGKLSMYQYAVNEGITLIFPSELRLGDPVYICWQWTKTTTGATNKPAFYVNIIDETTVRSNTVSHLGFSGGDYYSFEASFSDGIRNVAVTVKGGYNEKGTGTTSLVYQGSSPPTLFDSAPRIYVGKLTNWAPYAVDEMLVIVAPESMDEGKDICAFWQWTETGSGDPKWNVDDIATIKGVQWKDKKGESFHFFQGDNDYYRFDVTVDEWREQLTLTMKNPKGESTGDLIFDQQSLQISSVSRKKRSIWNHTTEVDNNSGEIVLCSLTNSGTTFWDKMLAGSSMILA